MHCGLVERGVCYGGGRVCLSTNKKAGYLPRRRNFPLAFLFISMAVAWLDCAVLTKQTLLGSDNNLFCHISHIRLVRKRAYESTYTTVQ